MGLSAKKIFYQLDINVAKLYQTLTQEEAGSQKKPKDTSFKQKKAIQEISKNFVVRGRTLLESTRVFPTSKNVTYNKQNATYYSNVTGYVHYGHAKKIEITVFPFFIISEDKMSLHVLMPCGEHTDETLHITKDWLQELLEANNIQIDIQENIVEELYNVYKTGNGGGLVRLGQGKPPRPGYAERVKLVGMDLRQGLGDSHFPGLSYEEIKYFRKVKAGELIGDYVQESPGQAGYDVMGNKIDYKANRPSNIGKFLSRSSEDTLLSEIDGVLRIGFDSRVYISKPYYHEGDLDTDLNVPAGHDLVVTGSVLNCQSLECSGSVTIYGNVENSKIVCQDDLIVAGGIVRKSFIDTGASLEAQFASNSELNVGGSLKVRKYLTFCKTTVLKNMLILDEEKGKISAGTIHLGGSLVAAELGSQTGSTTKIMVLKNIGGEKIRNKIIHLNKEKINAEASYTKLSRALGEAFETNPREYLQNIPESRYNKTVSAIKYLRSLTEKRSLIDEQIAELKKELHENKIKHQETKKSIFITKRYFWGISVVINDRSFVAERSLDRPTKIYYDLSRSELVREALYLHSSSHLELLELNL